MKYGQESGLFASGADKASQLSSSQNGYRNGKSFAPEPRLSPEYESDPAKDANGGVLSTIGLNACLAIMRIHFHVWRPTDAPDAM